MYPGPGEVRGCCLVRQAVARIGPGTGLSAHFGAGSSTLALVADYPRREVFPNAPLEFVACEIRVPTAPKLVREDTFEALTDELAGVLPIPDQEQVQTLTLTVIGGKNGGVETERRYRFLNRERTASAVVARNAITVETTDYQEFREFRSLVLTVADAVAATTKIVGIERIGLRYINEVRVPDEITDASDWRGWISDEVLGVLSVAESYQTAGFQTVLRLAGEDSTGVVLRYAAMVGDGVVGDDPLRRRAPASTGPFFVIDTDSYRTSQGPDMEDFVHQTIAEVLDLIHEPVGTLFHRAITDRLREEFRRT